VARGLRGWSTGRLDRTLVRRVFLSAIDTRAELLATGLLLGEKLAVGTEYVREILGLRFCRLSRGQRQGMLVI
jgi:hypothetical protein